MKLIDLPKKVSRSDYQMSIEDVTKGLSKLDIVHSVYQIGSISNLGISDIDMLVVFYDEAHYHEDVRKHFGVNTYLFTHNLYGCSESHWKKLQDYTFFHNYKLLHGKGFDDLSSSLELQQIAKLQRQIALEFLVKNFFTLMIQKKYQTVKVRSFLLEGKALIYDLEFLGIQEGQLWNLVNQIIDLRFNWFKKKEPKRELIEYFTLLPDLIKDLLIKELQKDHLFLPTNEKVALTKNVSLINGEDVRIKSSGIVPPDIGLLPERKRFNALHRINKFEVILPFEKSKKGDVIQQRFDFLSEVKSYNTRYLPHFLIPATSLKIS